MTIVDEIEELRAELRHCRRERREAEAKLVDLIRKRDEHDNAPEIHD